MEGRIYGKGFEARIKSAEVMEGKSGDAEIGKLDLGNGPRSTFTSAVCTAERCPTG